MHRVLGAALVSLFVAMPAQAGAPFSFGWPPGTVQVTSSEKWGAVGIRREFVLELEKTESGYLLKRSKDRIIGVDGPLSFEQVDAMERHLAPLIRPLVLDERGVARRVKPLDEAVFKDLQATLPADPTVRALLRPRLGSMEQVEVADADEVHLWNAAVGYWTGRDRSLNRSVRARLPDERVLTLEQLGPVSEPMGARHLSASAIGDKPGDVRGCSPEIIQGLGPGLKAAGAETAEVLHILETVECTRTETVETVTDPDSLRPHLVVLQSRTEVRLPGRTPTERKTTLRRDYVWPR